MIANVGPAISIAIGSAIGMIIMNNSNSPNLYIDLLKHPQFRDKWSPFCNPGHPKGLRELKWIEE